MRTTTNTARGKPLAVALLFLLLACVSGAAWGEGSLLVEQSISPAEINVAGMGVKPDVVTLGIALTGTGATVRYPFDCVVVVDTSVSTELDNAKAFAYEFVGRLGAPDRVGVVAFGRTAELLVPLAEGTTVASASGETKAQVAVAGLVEDTKSALGAGLELARGELERNGRSDAILVIVLIADGQNSVGAAPTIETVLAGDEGIRMATVGVVPVFNRGLLKGLAEGSGGVFVAGLGREGVGVLLDYLLTLPAATDIAVTKRVPAGLRFAGSTPAPSASHVERDGSTTITWEIDHVGVGETARIEARFGATVGGTLMSDSSASNVVYRDYRGAAVEVSLASVTLTAIMPNRAPVAAFSFDPASPAASDIVAFRDESRDPDAEDGIAAWHWTFGDGTTSEAEAPEHQYAQGTYKASLSVVDEHGLASSAVTQTIVVGNGIPILSLVFRDPSSGLELPAPLLGADVTLDASASRDVDGRIVLYRWDVDGDGKIDAETSDPTYETSYGLEGEQSLTLWLTDDAGNVTEESITFDVVPGITVERSILTHLPGDETIAAATVEVTLTVSANASMHGMMVSETIPTGWTLVDVTGDTDPLSAPTLRTTSTSAEWAFAEDVVAGSPNSRRVIKYTITSPSALPASDRTTVALQGYVSSSSPRLSQTTLGEDRITLLKYLSIPVAISCWNTTTGAVDLAVGDPDLGGGTITAAQLEYALSLWQGGATVPATNEKIDAAMMRELIAYSETRSSVFDPLP